MSVPQPDEELLAAWSAGDTSAGDRLFVRHFAAIDRFFVNKAARGEVGDLVQRTFMICVERAHTFASRASFRAFLLGIARNVLRDHYRAMTKGRRNVGEVSVADLSPGPSAVFAKREEQRLLLHALRSVPIDAQVILELYYWEELTGVEIAEILGVPENTARTRLRRARLRVARELERLADSPGLLDSTQGDLEKWARSLRPSPTTG